MMRDTRLATAALAVSGMVLATLAVSAHGNRGRFSAVLAGDNEVPSVSTNARGRLHLDIGSNTIEYKLSYSGLQGNVTQAHIHFAQPGVNGGIVLWLCQATATPSPDLGINPPLCPQSGDVNGVLTAADVVPIGAQQISATELAEVVKLIRNGLAYANVHTSISPGGEIRGQIGDDRR